jgi:hypothetical protein
MLNFFLAGPDLVRWELTALGAHGTGPFRLVIRHAGGSIVEYFESVTNALLRESELEELLTAARTFTGTDVGRGAETDTPKPASPVDWSKP